MARLHQLHSQPFYIPTVQWELQASLQKYSQYLMVTDIDIPLDIVWVIQLLLNREYLHLIQSDRGSHWRILVADIVSNAVLIK